MAGSERRRSSAARLVRSAESRADRVVAGRSAALIVSRVSSTNLANASWDSISLLNSDVIRSICASCVLVVVRNFRESALSAGISLS